MRCLNDDHGRPSHSTGVPFLITADSSGCLSTVTVDIQAGLAPLLPSGASCDLAWDQGTTTCSGCRTCRLLFSCREWGGWGRGGFRSRLVCPLPAAPHDRIDLGVVVCFISECERRSTPALTYGAGSPRSPENSLGTTRNGLKSDDNVFKQVPTRVLNKSSDFQVERVLHKQGRGIGVYSCGHLFTAADMQTDKWYVLATSPALVVDKQPWAPQVLAHDVQTQSPSSIHRRRAVKRNRPRGTISTCPTRLVPRFRRKPRSVAWAPPLALSACAASLGCLPVPSSTHSDAHSDQSLSLARDSHPLLSDGSSVALLRHLYLNIKRCNGLYHFGSQETVQGAEGVPLGNSGRQLPRGSGAGGLRQH